MCDAGRRKYGNPAFAEEGRLIIAPTTFYRQTFVGAAVPGGPYKNL
jgi:hypothetical protein